MEIHPMFIFLVIFLSVPAQYYFSPSNAGHIKYHFKKLATTISNYLPEIWEKGNGKGKDEEVVIEKKEGEDLDDFDTIDQFGLGHYERIRSPNVKFRVGDIVYHKILGYRAVIIGWDEKAMAPKEFIQQVHRGKSEWTNNPNYAVAIDLRDRMNPQIGYVVQENLELSKGRVLQIITAKYFEKFDEHRNRYVMRPFMREFYPDD